ncbi:hypothetical protein ASPCAL06875 [Aspergillus calidoustus]|uniref:Uncharacterized protein n=1 Tax=Aspergillus calidoustus TaxID=454130 RepID=A0A0U5G1Z2_ASPCI|nr:hypothetical protein ASPCAL06875 [Aspergillus calidoustus]
MTTSRVLWLLLHLTLLLPIAAAILFVFVYYHRPDTSITTKGKSQTTVFKTVPERRAIIAAAQVPNDKRKTQLTTHEARAWSNQRLQRAFGIQNAFTTGNGADARTFVTEAHRLIRVSAVDWDGLSSMLSRMVLDLMDWAAVADEDGSASASGGGTRLKSHAGSGGTGSGAQDVTCGSVRDEWY